MSCPKTALILSFVYDVSFVLVLVRVCEKSFYAFFVRCSCSKLVILKISCLILISSDVSDCDNSTTVININYCNK